MQIAKFLATDGRTRIGIVDGDRIQPLVASLSEMNVILEAADPHACAQTLLAASETPLERARTKLLAPIDRQEVWAAGVTYKRSMAARMEESESAASLYDKVYLSPRPELFFKATPNRVVGSGGGLRIRRDSQWNVPEPEVALVINSRMELVGYTIGNDMSSRDIEGENPLYLPQAKVYDACCGLGPWITLASPEFDATKLAISMVVRRDNRVVFSGNTSVTQMARTFADLIDWLGRDNRFDQGVILLTGTGIVPDSDFTLHSGDEVQITVEGLGTLVNPITQAA